MITTLDIKGLAVIDSLHINFSEGFNVITGETGAGKSILIKALSILLGTSKNTKESIRTGEESASISATFELSIHHPVIDLLNDLSLPIDIDDSNEKASFIIRRNITTSKSQCYLNDVSISISTLKKISPLLVDIFAQNESHQLLDIDTHIKYLDKFIDINQIKKVKDLYLKSSSILKEINSLSVSYKSRLKDKDYILYRIKEISDFNPSCEDYYTIKTECDQCINSYKIKELLSETQNLIDGDNLNPLSSIFIKLSKNMSLLKEFEEITEQDELKDYCSSLENIITKLNDISYFLSKKNSSFFFDEEQIKNNEQRLSSYQDLFRKFGVGSIEDFLQEYQKMQDSLSLLENYEENLICLIEELHTISILLQKESTTLFNLRKKASLKIKELIEKELHSLSMPNAIFDIKFIPISNPKEPLDLSFVGKDFYAKDKYIKALDILSNHSELGTEKAVFFLSANKGENLLALNKVASGGEISRIMLALKQVLSMGADTCVLIFDEIDSGISGKVATLVGKKLKQLSKKFQVFCISHLAQVAVYADTHFLVKKEEKSRTKTSIIKLNKDESIKEIARLLSGENITESSIENAINLKQDANL